MRLRESSVGETGNDLQRRTKAQMVSLQLSLLLTGSRCSLACHCPVETVMINPAVLSLVLFRSGM